MRYLFAFHHSRRVVCSVGLTFERHQRHLCPEEHCRAPGVEAGALAVPLGQQTAALLHHHSPHVPPAEQAGLPGAEPGQQGAGRLLQLERALVLPVVMMVRGQRAPGSGILGRKIEVRSQMTDPLDQLYRDQRSQVMHSEVSGPTYEVMGHR